MKGEIVEEEKRQYAETLIIPDTHIDMKSEESSSEEVEDVSHQYIETPFTVKDKFKKRMLVFKEHCRDKMNVYQGEVSRLRKRLGIITSKKMVYLCINKDRINMYRLPLTATPIRQFLYDWEKISSKVDIKDPKVLRLYVNKKEYVFKLEEEGQAQEWSEYINNAVKNKDAAQEPSRLKTWRTPHVTRNRFTKEANTFDLLKFKDHGEKTYGIVLQTIDKGASKDLLYKDFPEVLYYNHHLKKVVISSVEEVFTTKDVYIIPLINYEWDEQRLETAVEMIVKVVSLLSLSSVNLLSYSLIFTKALRSDNSLQVKKSKEDPKFSTADFAQFMQDLYIQLKVLMIKSLDKSVKKLTFRDIFDESNTDYEGDCYFDAAHKIITQK